MRYIAYFLSRTYHAFCADKHKVKRAITVNSYLRYVVLCMETINFMFVIIFIICRMAIYREQTLSVKTTIKRIQSAKIMVTEKYTRN